MNFKNSKYGINPVDAINAAERQRKLSTLYKTFNALKGAGNYKVIFPVVNYGSEEDPVFGLVVAKSTTAKINLATETRPNNIGRVVYSEDMLEPRDSVDSMPIDKTLLRPLRKLGTLFRMGQMEEEIAKCTDKFSKMSNVPASELDMSIRKIKAKYLYDKDLKISLIDDIVGRPQDVIGTICVVVLLDNNNKPFLDSNGNIDPTTVKLATYQLSNKRNRDFVDVLSNKDNVKYLKDIEMEVEGDDHQMERIKFPGYALETNVVFRGAATQQEAALVMKDLQFMPLQVGRLIDGEKAAQLIGDKLIYDQSAIFHKSSGLSSGWSLQDAESRIRQYFSENQTSLAYAKTDTKAFKYGSKALAENKDLFERISNSDIIKAATGSSATPTKEEEKYEEVTAAKTDKEDATKAESNNIGDMFSLD